MFWFLGSLAAIGLVYWLLRRQNFSDYPDAQSLIIQLEDDLSQRVLNVDGVANFRDIGGYLNQEGGGGKDGGSFFFGKVKHGMIFRSGKLDQMTTVGWQTLTETLNVQWVCDMRSEEESTKAPDALCDDRIQYEALPLETLDDRLTQLRIILFNRRRLRDIVPVGYKNVIVDGNPHIFGAIIQRAADRDNLPLLIHCTAGKDRTGVAIALILALLGVPDDVIIADYTLSNLYYDDFYAVGEKLARRARWLGITADHLWPLLVAEADTMRQTLEHIRTQYGSIEAYVRDAAGVHDADIIRLRDHLLDN